MPSNIHHILKKYWGFDSFRPLQEDIINSALKGNDTLALLPTGGGKSICFQVPALAQEGLCIVVSPLIALMNDQVHNLRERDIPAIAITSLMNRREIDVALDNCVHGKYKFLYVSPERLQTEMFLMRVEKMKVNLLAIDESHCISQWGYDFRPSYLNIAQLREQIPKVPVLALTATATPEVVDDIQHQLKFKTKNVFSKSFARQNLAYWVLHEEDKFNRLHRIIQKIGGSGVVYVRSRKKTESIARELQQRNVIAEAYHAGLNGETREIRQTAWIKGHVQAMVATNAFGMGIDKSDVRWVVHLDLPDTLEAYFQEAGRAGRDEKPAKAIILYDLVDVDELKRKQKIAFPPKPFIKRVYKALGSHLRLADGSGKDESFPFNLIHFSKKYSFNPLEAYNALKILQQEGYIALSEAIYQPSRVMLQLGRERLYELEVKEPKIGKFIQLMLRSYSGLWDSYVSINESELAYRLKTSRAHVVSMLNTLHKRHLIQFFPASDEPMVTFMCEKLPVDNITLSNETYNWRKKRAEEKMNRMIDYVLSDQCRSQMLLNYFGQSRAELCGVCDYCYHQSLNKVSIEQASSQILLALKQNPFSADEIFERFQYTRETVLQSLEWLEESGKIKTQSNGIISALEPIDD